MSDLKAALIHVTPFQQNCTLLWCASTMTAVVIDPGGDVPVILDAIAQIGVKVEKIWITHGHMDHAGGADELRTALGGVPVEGPHRDDQFLLETLEDSSSFYGIFGSRNLVPDRWLAHNDSVSIGTLHFEVRHCPGHSPGSVVFINHAEKLILVGDVVFQGSIGRTDLPRGNHDALLASIHQHLLTLPDDYSFICGHGAMSTIGHERAHNPYLKARPQ